MKNKIQSLLKAKHVKSVIESMLSIGFVKIVAFYREIIVAATLSVGHGYDVFLFYLALVGFPSAILLNPLQSIFIKKIARIQNNRSQKKHILESDYVSNVVFGLLLTLPVMYLCWFSIFQLLVTQFGFFSKLNDGEHPIIIWYFAPYAVLSSLNIMLYGYLQAKSRFLSNGLFQVLTPLVSIVFLKTWPNTELTLLLGITFGTFFETIVLLGKIRKMVNGFFAHNDFNIGILFRLAWLSKGLMLGFLMTSLTPLIESVILFSSKVGDMSSYSFASKLPFAISSVLVTTSAIVSLPVLSQYFSTPSYRSILRRYFVLLSSAIVLSGLVCAAVASHFSAFIISLVFRQAAFSFEIVERMAIMQSYLFYQIPFAVLAIISTKALVASHKNLTVSFVMITGSAVYASFLSYFGSSLDGMRIAQFSTLSTAILSIVYFIFACTQVYRRIS